MNKNFFDYISILTIKKMLDLDECFFLLITHQKLVVEQILKSLFAVNKCSAIKKMYQSI